MKRTPSLFDGHQIFLSVLSSSVLQAILWWATTEYPVELPTKGAISEGMQQLVTAALAPGIPEDGDVGAFRIHFTVRKYAVPEEEKQALRKRLLAKSVAPPCENDPRHVHLHARHLVLDVLNMSHISGHTLI